ncbi:MAG: response regulator, partial [Shewanella sp.]
MALTGVAILLVEDDPVFRLTVASFLNSRGAQVTQACDGEQGLSFFKSQH